MANDQRQPSGVRYVDPFRDAGALTPIGPEERRILRTVNQKIAARPSLRAIVDYLFDRTQTLIPCDRLGLAFVDEKAERVTSYYTKANYDNLLIDKDYSEPLHGSSLERIMLSGQPRIIDDLERYLEHHPRSASSRLLVSEGVRSSLTCPLSVEGRIVGFMFRSSRRAQTYRTRHIELQMAITERMLGFVSHELKSPVASMVTDAQLLAQGYLGDITEEQRAKLESLARKGQYLLSLVREYLDLARVEGSELKIEPRSRVDIDRDVVTEAVDIVRPQLEARDMRIVTDVPHELPVCCDATLLRIVLVNLLDNAAKYGNEHGEVRVSAEVTPGSQGRPDKLQVCVWNEGPGFPPSQRNKLFKRFSRLDDPALKGRRGTGVGLYNAWRIVQLHRGHITAESKQGEWARFCFDIPAVADCPLPTAAGKTGAQT
jgi:signal transduction histidine kinase